MNRVLFYEREFEPGKKLPKPCFYQAQYDELIRYCGYHGLVLVEDFGELNDQEVPLLKQPKIKAMLQWIDKHPGEVDTVLVCTPAHLTKNKGHLRAFANKLTERRIELFFLKGGKYQITLDEDEYEKIINQYIPGLLKIYKDLRKLNTSNCFDLQEIALANLEKEKALQFLKSLFNNSDFFNCFSTTQRDRAFFGTVYQEVFKHENLPSWRKKEAIMSKVRKTKAWKKYQQDN